MSLKQEKALYYDTSFLGLIGEEANRKDSLGNDLHIGDVVSFEHWNKKFVKVVASHGDNVYGLFGFGTNTLDFDKLVKIVPYNYLTEELFIAIQETTSHFDRSLFKIKDYEVREMTVREIEKELGCRIKIVK